jgi:RND family efflux transporter MFP subunit
MPEEKANLDDLRIDRSALPPRSGRLWGLLAAGLVLLAVAAGLLWWWLAGSVPEVEAAPVQEVSGGAEAVLEASGYVTARRQATVSSKVTGKLTEVRVEEGMRVAEGQLLARLDDALAERLLALAEAQRVAAQQRLTEIEVQLEEAAITLRRTRRLEAAGVAPTADLDRDQAAFDSLAARLEAAQEEVAVAERQVDVRLQELDDTFIRAPFAGVAVSKDAQPGEMISPVSAGGGFTRTGVCTIVDMGSLEIEVDVNEAYINRVEDDQPVTAVLDAYPDWRIPARVITTVPTADRQKATVRVRIGFDHLDPRILPDMGVKVTFLEAEAEAQQRPSRLLVPQAAVRDEAGQPVVFVVDGETVERRAVSLGAADGERREVVSGLAAGERVVVAGPADLADGQRVKLPSR